MNNLSQQQKQMVISGVIILVVIIAGVVFISRNNTSKPNGNSGQDVLPTSQVIPTVNKSVKVDLVPNKKKTSVTLKVSNMPKGTTKLWYEIMYNTADNAIQGADTLDPIDVAGEDSFEETFLLGTQSSGNTVYHKVVGHISVNLKFQGPYGKQVYEGKFSLDDE